ncbi:MAG: hypothetical protein KF819_28235 [Labilithrix sp.]|nr:hypothetical protein [Labilithrix sp.]
MHRCFALALCLTVFACDPLTTVQGRVVRAPTSEAVSGAEVNVRCEGLAPAEGLKATTDASGSFTMTTAGGALADTCTLHVSEGGGNPVRTTIGATKAKGDDPGNRVRQVEVALPAK